MSELPPVHFPNVFLTEHPEFGRNRLQNQLDAERLVGLFDRAYTLFVPGKALFVETRNLLEESVATVLAPSNPLNISEEDRNRLEEVRSIFERATSEEEFREGVDSLRRALLESRSKTVRDLAGVVGALVERLLPSEREIVDLLRQRREAGLIPPYPEDQRRVRQSERVNPIEFLRSYFGEFLTYFGAAENRLFQADLRTFDPRFLEVLLSRVNYLRRRDPSFPEFSSIVPPLAEAGSPSPLSSRTTRQFLAAQIGSGRSER